METYVIHYREVKTTMAFRDKVRGPLGWILGAVGGLALLLGSFFAGMATADTSVDQEQASVTEQQEDTRDRDADGGAESGTESEDQDANAEKGTRPDREDTRNDADDDAGPDGEPPADAPDEGSEDQPGPGRHHKHDDHHGHDGEDSPAEDNAPAEDDPTA